MKRTITLAVLASLLLGLFGGYASAQTEEPVVSVSEETDSVTDEVNIRRILHFCRKMFGENDFSPERKEKCIEIWKRWCSAHPNSRICPDRPPRPCRDATIDRITDRICPKPKPEPHPCRVTDRPIDLRCPEPKPEPHPCRVLDEVNDRRCPIPKPCVDWQTDLGATDEVRCPVPLPIPVPHPCPPLDRLNVSLDSARLSVSIDRLCYPPVDPVPIDRLKDRIIDRPTDKVLDRAPQDRVEDRTEVVTTDRSLDEKEWPSDDAHFGAAIADH